MKHETTHEIEIEAHIQPADRSVGINSAYVEQIIITLCGHDISEFLPTPVVDRLEEIVMEEKSQAHSREIERREAALEDEAEARSEIRRLGRSRA